MSDDAAQIAARLAGASTWFPLPHDDVGGKAVRESAVFVEAEGNVINVCVTDHDGRRHEYRAEVRPINESAPDVAATTTEGDSNHHHATEEF